MKPGRLRTLWYSRLLLLGGSGILMQAGGCGVDTSSLIAQVIVATGSSLIQGVVFGAFNLV